MKMLEMCEEAHLIGREIKEQLRKNRNREAGLLQEVILIKY